MIFRLILNSTGLSQREAASFLDVDERTVRRWVAGQYDPPQGVAEEMIALIRQQEKAANALLSTMREKSADNGLPETIDCLVAESDEAAQERGWPTVSSQMASFRRLIEIAPDEIRERVVIISS